jgi:hypothetical protein
MKVQELCTEEMARLNATHRVIITVADINGLGTGYGALSPAAAAATTGTLKPFSTLPIGTLVQFVMGYLAAAFVPASSTALTLQIGYDLSSGTDKVAGYSVASSLCSTASPVKYLPIEIADAGGTYTSAEQTCINALIKNTLKVFSVANDLGLLLTSTTANLTDYVGVGELHLYFRVLDLTKY